MRVQGVLETSLYVDDLEAAEEFYGRVLMLELHSVQEQRHAFFRCGTGMLLLFNPLASAVSGSDEPQAPTHGAEGPGHVAFAVEASSLDEWRQHLAACGVPIEQELTWPGGQVSIYFRDPAGNSLELASASLWTNSA